MGSGLDYIRDLLTNYEGFYKEYDNCSTWGSIPDFCSIQIKEIDKINDIGNSFFRYPGYLKTKKSVRGNCNPDYSQYSILCEKIDPTEFNSCNSQHEEYTEFVDNSIHINIGNICYKSEGPYMFGDDFQCPIGCKKFFYFQNLNVIFLCQYYIHSRRTL